MRTCPPRTERCWRSLHSPLPELLTLSGEAAKSTGPLRALIGSGWTGGPREAVESIHDLLARQVQRQRKILSTDTLLGNNLTFIHKVPSIEEEPVAILVA